MTVGKTHNELNFLLTSYRSDTY